MPHLRSERDVPLDAGGKSLPGGVGCTEALKWPSGKLKPGPGKPPAEVADHQPARIRGALLELVVEEGYPAVTVRKLAGRAGVSSRSFYQRYPNKEACFLSVHQSAVHRTLRVIEAAGLDARGVDQRLGFVAAALIREWAAEPRAAHLMLIDAYAAGQPALKQARLAGRSVEARIGECLDLPSDDANLAPLAAEAVLAGVLSAARCRLIDGGGGLAGLHESLGRWAAAYQELPTGQIAEIRLGGHASPGTDEIPSGGDGGQGTTVAEEGDRGLLLAATAKLVAARGNADLGLDEIASTAGVSRRGVEAVFPDSETCIAAAHRLYSNRAIDRVGVEGELTSGGNTCRHPFTSMVVEVATDPTLAALCFSDVAISGPRLAQSHRQALADLAPLAAGGAEPAGPAAEASAGALWGTLRQRVVMGRVAQALEFAPVLTHLALLPLHAGASRLSTR